MKKFCILLSVVLCINLTACFDSTNKSEKTEAINSNVLTIATFEDIHNYYLEEAVQKFQELNPDIKVEIKVYGNSIDDEDKIEKYVSTINTELMSGKAPDIIHLKDIPYKKYIDSGMLVNISELMKKDSSFNINNYNTNVFEALKYKDGLYTIPMSYRIQLITGNYDLEIDDDNYSWQDFLTSAQKVLSNKDYILSETDIILFKQIFRSEYKRFIDEENKTANFTSKEFIDILKYCKNLADNKIIYKSDEDLDKVTPMLGFITTMTFKYILISASESYVEDNAVRYFYKYPSNHKKSTATFSIQDMYTINNSSDNKVLAWEFIKFMLSDKMQISSNLRSFPVNNTGFDRKIDRNSKEFIDEIKETNKIPLEKANELIKDYTEQFKEFTSSMTTCIDTNIEIFNIVMKYVEMYFTEQKTAEETAQIIQNKVSIYLNEQR